MADEKSKRTKISWEEGFNRFSPESLSYVFASGNGALPMNTAYREEHPSAAEAQIPIWGPARSMIAYQDEHNHGAALLSGATMGADAVTLMLTGGGVAQGRAVNTLRGRHQGNPPSYTYNAVSKRMTTRGMAPPKGSQTHHGGVPRRARWVPDQIMNHPLNFRQVPKAVHARIHGIHSTLPRYPLPERFVRGAPVWMQTGLVGLLGHVGTAATQAIDKRRKRDGGR